MKKRIFAITGIGGHLGSTIAHDLLMQGETVRGFYLPNEKNIVPGTSVYYGDVTKPATLVPFLLHRPDEEIILIHCAALISISKHVSKRVYDVNVTGTENVVEIAKALGVKRLVHVSSVHAIEEPPKGTQIVETKHFDPRLVHGEYAKTKAEATNYVLNAETDIFEVVVVHPSGIIGPGYTQAGDFLSHVITMYLAGKLKVAVKGGYDFVDVRDVADGVISAALNGRSGETYILAGGYYTIKEITDLLSKITDLKPTKVFLAPKFVRSVVWIVEWYYKVKKQTPLFTAYSMSTLEANADFSTKKAHLELGYNPRPLISTLADTVNEAKTKATIKGFTVKKSKKN